MSQRNSMSKHTDYYDYVVFGGDGFLGTGLVKELRQRGKNGRRVLVRGIADYDLSNPQNIPLICEDIKKTGHIIMMAAKVGVSNFSSEDVATKSWITNVSINNNIISAIDKVWAETGRQFCVTFYSTSEIYGSLDSIYADPINQYSDVRLNAHGRGLYAYEKYTTAVALHNRTSHFADYMDEHKPIFSLNILKPFNVSGLNQLRGVVYTMYKSAKEIGDIVYRVDTTRTITPDWVASKQAADIIETGDGSPIIASPEYSFTLETLAKMIKDICEKDFGYPEIRLTCIDPDNSVRYRHLSFPDKNMEVFRPVLKRILKRIDGDENA